MVDLVVPLVVLSTLVLTKASADASMCLSSYKKPCTHFPLAFSVSLDSAEMLSANRYERSETLPAPHVTCPDDRPSESRNGDVRQETHLKHFPRALL